MSPWSPLKNHDSIKQEGWSPVAKMSYQNLVWIKFGRWPVRARRTSQKGGRALARPEIGPQTGFGQNLPTTHETQTNGLIKNHAHSSFDYALSRGRSSKKVQSVVEQPLETWILHNDRDRVITAFNVSQVNQLSQYNFISINIRVFS